MFLSCLRVWRFVRESSVIELPSCLAVRESCHGYCTFAGIVSLRIFSGEPVVGARCRSLPHTKGVADLSLRNSYVSLALSPILSVVHSHSFVPLSLPNSPTHYGSHSVDRPHILRREELRKKNAGALFVPPPQTLSLSQPVDVTPAFWPILTLLLSSSATNHH